MVPLSVLVIKRLEWLLINWLVIFLFSIICLSLSLKIKEERAKPFRIEIDLFLTNACVGAGSLLMSDSIFLIQLSFFSC